MAVLVKVRFLKGHPKYAYFAGDVGSISPGAAHTLQKEGYVVLIPETEGEERNPLPEDLPARDLLFKEGYETIEQITEADKALTDINGIGAGTLRKIKQFIKDQK